MVLSNDTAIALLNVIMLNGERRKAMADQISTVSTRRLQRRLGALGKDDLDAVIRAVRLQLGL